MPHEMARRLAELVDPGLMPVLDRVDAGTATAADVQAIRDWPAAHRAQVLDHVRAAVPPIPQLADALNSLGFPADGWHPSTSLGPATVSVDCPAAVVSVGGATIVLGILPPTGGALALDAGALSAAGTLMRDGDGAAGSLGVRLGPAQVIGFGRLDVPDGTPSIVVVLGIHFLPPIQLSFGFALSAVGGVVGINRRIDKDALHARLADGSALDALFPDDPVKGAGIVLATLGAIFQRQPGQHVVGPTFTVTWLDIGVTTIVRLDLGLLLQLPDPLIVIVGRGAIELPPVLQLRLDVAGELDPGRKTFGLDAVLVDSHALDIFRVTGSATVRLGWGSPSYVVFAVGGFYPGFRPEPANIPPQQRLGLALDIPCPLSFRAERLPRDHLQLLPGGRRHRGRDRPGRDQRERLPPLRRDHPVRPVPPPRRLLRRLGDRGDDLLGRHDRLRLDRRAGAVGGPRRGLDQPPDRRLHVERHVPLWAVRAAAGPAARARRRRAGADARRRLAHPLDRRDRSARLDPAAQGRGGEGPRRVLAARGSLVDGDGAPARPADHTRRRQAPRLAAGARRPDRPDARAAGADAGGVRLVRARHLPGLHGGRGVEPAAVPVAARRNVAGAGACVGIHGDGDARLPVVLPPGPEHVA